MATIYTQAHLDSVDNAIASRRLDSLTIAGETYEFMSLDDLFKLRAHIVGQLTPATSTSSGYRLAATSKGV